MEVVPNRFLRIIEQDKNLHKAILDIDSKIEVITRNQPPVLS